MVRIAAEERRTKERKFSAAEDARGTYEPVLTTHAQCYSRPMIYDIYVDGTYAASLGCEWDAAARWIGKHTAYRTPLRRLAELGETYRPEQAAVMLSDLLENHNPGPDIAHTLRHLHRFLTGDHVLITDGVMDKPSAWGGQSLVRRPPCLHLVAAA